jgi:hypothetical protein
MLHYIKEHKFDCTEGLANMQLILAIVAAVIVTASLLSPTSILSPTHSPSIAYATTNVTSNNETGNVPNLITTPPPLVSSVDRTDAGGGGAADVNITNATQLEQQTQTPPQRQQSSLRAEAGSEIVGSQTVRGGLQTQESNNSFIEPITKGQAAEAEQEANAMIDAYYEELEQKNEASVLATSKLNQTRGALLEQAGCVTGEISVQVGNSTVCLSSYEISIACNPGGSLVGDPLCSNTDFSSIQQPSANLPSPEVEREEVIEESGGQVQEPGSGEEEALEEGSAGEQEVIEDFE